MHPEPPSQSAPCHRRLRPFSLLQFHCDRLNQPHFHPQFRPNAIDPRATADAALWSVSHVMLTVRLLAV